MSDQGGSGGEASDDRRAASGGVARPEAPASAAAVSLDGLTKRYEETVAVDGVDLAVERGELLVLLGPSGCGKTTTLRMIAGLESITEGGVTIGGTDVTRVAPQNRDVAMVFQNYALYPHKTVRQNVRFPLRKTDLSDEEIHDRIEETARLLDIDDLLDKQPAALSGGQRQRVAVGRAIAREPEVLLMDEPLSNLDAKLRVRTRSELRDLQQRLDITTVYVTHDQEEAMSIADRIAIMDGGRLEQVGPPEEMYREPKNEFIAGFLGDPPMNLLAVRTGSGGESSVVEAAFADAALPGGTDALPPDAHRFGVRPEDLYLARADGTVPGGESPAAVTDAVACSVSVIEPIGRAYELTLRADGREFVARRRTIPDGVREGDTAHVVFDREKLYAFDEAGVRIA
jgi:multiple sugar transport system ATP-binding protein